MAVGFQQSAIREEVINRIAVSNRQFTVSKRALDESQASLLIAESERSERPNC